jgi:hypothetical protein
MGGNTSSPKPDDPTVYAGGFSQLAQVTRTESVAVFTDESFSLGTICGNELRKRFGGLSWLKNQGVKSGNIVPVKYNGRYVYYIIVSKTSYSNATLADLQAALALLVAHMDAQNVPKVIFENVPPQGILKIDFDNAISEAMGNRLWDYYSS